MSLRPSKHPQLLLSHELGRLDEAISELWNGRAAIVSISASDCRIDAAIHKSLTIAAADAEPRWRSGSGQGA